MIAFDTSFLVAYLEGDPDTASFLDAHGEQPLFVPSLALFEVYRGAARTGGVNQIERVMTGLDWLEPLPLTEPAARDAARIEMDLLEEGEPVNLGDTLIAGICRHHGARIVTRDTHFERVPELEVLGF